MAISYEDALATLTSMFGPPWTQETLDVVLRHYQGHMENTVDCVLRYGDGDPQVLIAQLHSGKTPDEVNSELDEQLALQLAQEERVKPRAPTRWAQTTTSQPPPAHRPTKKGRGTPTELPPDFLRIPGAETTAASMDSDEALARMLQDELFAQELRNNPEFAHLARGRSRPHMVGGRPSSARSSSGHVGGLPRASSGRTGFPGGGQRTSGGAGHDILDRISGESNLGVSRCEHHLIR